MSTMDGLAARFRRRAGKSKRAEVAGGDASGHTREANGVGPVLTPRPRPRAEAEAVARAVLDALRSHDAL
jgi:hypothetical protein